MQLPAQCLGGSYNFGAHIVVDVGGRVHGDAVAGMDARALHVFHDAGNQDVFPVADGVNLDFHAGQVFVDEHRIVLLMGEDDGHVFLDILVTVSNDHILSAQHIGRTHENGVAQFTGCGKGFFRGHDGMALRTLDAGTFQQRVKTFPVLGHIDGVGGGSQNRYLILRQSLGQLDGGLPAERHHHADRLFDVDDIHHVLGGQGLKVQPVCCVEVRGDRFRVVIDDDDLVSQLLQRKHAVNAGIVELDALADSNGTGAQHHYGLLFPVIPDKFQSLILTARFFRVIGGVKIRGMGGKLASASIHHLKGGLADKFHFAARQPLNGGIRIAQLLAPGIKLFSQHAFFQLTLVGKEIQELGQEPAVDHGLLVHLFHGDTAL